MLDFFRSAKMMVRDQSPDVIALWETRVPACRCNGILQNLGFYGIVLWRGEGIPVRSGLPRTKTK